MENKPQIIRLALLILALVLIQYGTVHARGEKVTVIAPSASTSIEAHAIMLRLGWVETNLREAQVILVVVRSMRYEPLSDLYGSHKELQEDANKQLNTSGPDFHVYIYRINDDLSVTQIRHTSYEADD
jgi:hypothetical protein